METPFRRLGLAPKAGCGRSERDGAGALETEDSLFEIADGEDGADLVPLCDLACETVCGKGGNYLALRDICILRLLHQVMIYRKRVQMGKYRCGQGDSSGGRIYKKTT